MTRLYLESRTIKRIKQTMDILTKALKDAELVLWELEGGVELT